MRAKSYRMRGRWLSDMAIGAAIFVALAIMPAIESGQHWSVSEANATEVIASRAVEVTTPPGPVADNAIVAAAQLRPAQDPLLARHITAMVSLGLTFSLLVAFNLAFARHLRRVTAAQRRDEWRRRR